jgi:hypothetical protein
VGNHRTASARSTDATDTTMIYTHALNRGRLGVTSPIDRW